MLRLSISEKHLCFLPAVLLTSQVFFRILFLQSSGKTEAAAFSLIPTVFVALAVGFVVSSNRLAKQNRFLLHTILFALLVSCTTIPPGFFYNIELILTCILAGIIYGGCPEKNSVTRYVVAGILFSALLFFPKETAVRYMTFILLPVAQLCLLTAYFRMAITSRFRIVSGIPLLLSLLILGAVSWYLFTHTGTANSDRFQQKHRLTIRQTEQLHPGNLLPVLALLGQQDQPEKIRIALVEDAPFPVLKLLSPLEKAGAIGKLDIFHISYVQNSQRFFPPFRYPDPTPSEIPEQTANHDLVIVAPPIPTERSAAFLSTAVFFKQVCDALPDNGILAVFATGSDAQNMTLYHSMPSGTVRINGENSTWFVCRKDGGKLELDGKELGKRLPEILRHYSDAMQLVFPLLQKDALPVPDGDLANRPFHSPLLRLIDPTPEMPALSFIRSWHGVLFAAALVLYLLMRYFISWKPVHKPCFQAFEAGLLAMLLPAAAVIGGASFGCGPIFSIIPAVTAVFAATYFYLLLLPEEKYAKYNMFPLVLAILLFLAGWDLPAATAIIGALLLWNARKRPVPELSDAQRIYPQAWLMTGMAIALTAATFFLKMPI